MEDRGEEWDWGFRDSLETTPHDVVVCYVWKAGEDVEHNLHNIPCGSEGLDQAVFVMFDEHLLLEDVVCEFRESQS